MAGVLNKTARPYYIKAQDKKTAVRTKVSIYPGLNEVDDKHWNLVKGCKFVKDLAAADKIAFGNTVDDLLLERAPDTVSVSKSENSKAKTKD